MGNILSNLVSYVVGGKKNDTNLQNMQTPEQQQAMSLLSQYGLTGSSGGLSSTGDLSGFNYNLTPAEVTGGNLLNQNLNDQSLSGARNALSGIINSEFNPDDPSNGFAAFQRQLARATKDSGDVIARNAAIGGSRFGSQVGKDYANLAAQQADITASTLADLWKQTQQNKLGAASGLANLEQASQSRINQAFQLGQQQRNIENAKAQAVYDDWKSARDTRLSTLSGVVNTNIDYGQKDYTTKSSGLIGQLLGAVATYLGTKDSGK